MSVTTPKRNGRRSTTGRSYSSISRIANESGFATQFGPNEYRGSLAAGDLLSDDPYLDTQPVPASGQQLYCVSPTNTLPVTDATAELPTQAAGTCPATFRPSRQTGFFRRLNWNVWIGNAF